MKDAVSASGDIIYPFSFTLTFDHALRMSRPSHDFWLTSLVSIECYLELVYGQNGLRSESEIKRNWGKPIKTMYYGLMLKYLVQ